MDNRSSALIYFLNFRACAVFLSVIFAVLSLSYDAFSQNRVKREVFSWRTLKSAHFNIHYPEGMDELAVHAITYAEEGYLATVNAFQFETTRVIPVIIYPSDIAFQENTVVDSLFGEGVGGFTEPIKGRVVVPFTGDYSVFRHVITHEIIHAVTFDFLGIGSGGISFPYAALSAPLWVIEGIAEYLSVGYDVSADTVMRDCFYNDQYATLQDLSLGRVKSDYLYYKEGQSFFWFLEKKYGKTATAKLMRAIRDEGNFNSAIKRVTGKNFTQINDEWVHFFKGIYFPVMKGKAFEQDIGVRYTLHPDDYSTYNSSPAVNPDGTKIAYLSNQGLYTHIAVMTLGKTKAKEIRTIVHGETSSQYERLHLLDNNLSWGADGRLLLCAQSGGKDALYIVNPDSGKVIECITPPVRAVRNPSLSRDGKKAVFIGQRDSSSDVFIYDFGTRALSRVTSDSFAERDPVFDTDGKSVIYSTNNNGSGRIDDVAFVIVRTWLTDGKTDVIVSNGSKNLQSELSPDGKNLLFVSDRSGIFNVYRRNFADGKDEKMSDVLCGIYSPVYFPDGKKIAFVSYQKLGYDIGVKDLPLQNEIDPSIRRDTIREDRLFTGSYLPPKYNSTVYDSSMSKDYLAAMGGGVIGSGGLALMGLIQGSYSDYLGEKRLLGTLEYYGFGDQSGANGDVSYWYMANRANLGLGIFTQSSPYGILSVETVNQLIHNTYTDTEGVLYYGVYSIVSYPFTRFIRADARFSSSRYEWKYSDKEDVYANLNKTELALFYDTSVWSFTGPIDGTRIMLQGESAVNATGREYSYQSLNIDLRRYFFFFDYYTFAFRLAGGRIFGRDRYAFKYSLGGFNSLRGYGYDDFEGEKMFLASAEFRFITIEGIKFGFPLYFGIGGIGGVLFADAGSAWDGAFHARKSDGSFDDLKTDFGFGFRLALAPAVSLKLDFAWPYNYKSLGSMNCFFSLGIDY